MKKIGLLLLISSLAFAGNKNLSLIKQCLLEHYPNSKEEILLQDSWSFSIPQNKQEYQQSLENPKLQDSFAYPYPLNSFTQESFKDSTRIRNYPLLQKTYGETKAIVESSLKEIEWLDGTILLFNTKNGAYQALLRVKTKLQSLLKANPQFLEFLQNIGGTYKWRKIAQTNRLSAHSFGIAIDINVAHSRYWLWDLEHHTQTRGNFEIPESIVNAFEEEGFIWGGRWWHYDSMHFEYRPEILCYAKSLKNLTP